MQVKNDHLVGVTEEAELFVGHLHGAMVHISHILDVRLQLVCVELYLGVSHDDALQRIGLLGDGLFLVLEVFDSV